MHLFKTSEIWFLAMTGEAIVFLLGDQDLQTA